MTADEIIVFVSSLPGVATVTASETNALAARRHDRRRE